MKLVGDITVLNDKDLAYMFWENMLNTFEQITMAPTSQNDIKYVQ